ncbi:MAG: AraC family transcriptional regulator ligand-binding domain-containing protein, partial [Gammaproteobacteria bacterium]|nr:AraC family transcriptional regulator ligand-binding domain-containing protein [Gammaproteobacteria bacterium]
MIPDELLQRAGRPARELLHRIRDVQVLAVGDLLEEFADRVQVPLVGEEAGQRLPVGRHGHVHVLHLAAQHAGEALRRIGEAQHLGAGDLVGLACVAGAREHRRGDGADVPHVRHHRAALAHGQEELALLPDGAGTAEEVLHEEVGLEQRPGETRRRQVLPGGIVDLRDRGLRRLCARGPEPGV